MQWIIEWSWVWFVLLLAAILWALLVCSGSLIAAVAFAWIANWLVSPLLSTRSPRCSVCNKIVTCRRSHKKSIETGNNMQLAGFVTKHYVPFKLFFWPSQYFHLFSKEHLKIYPKTVFKHISQQSNTKCANVISQKAGLQGCRHSGAAWGAIKKLGQWKIIKTNCDQYVCFCSATMPTSKIITEICCSHNAALPWADQRESRTENHQHNSNRDSLLD